MGNDIPGHSGPIKPMTAPATARELYDRLYGQETRPKNRLEIIQQALDAAVARHVEHHRCDRCYSAGQAVLFALIEDYTMRARQSHQAPNAMAWLDDLYNEAAALRAPEAGG